MNDTEFLELAMRHQDGTLSAAETSAFEAAMLADPAKRRLFTEAQLRSMALHDRFRQEAFRVAPPEKQRRAWHTRPAAAMAAGLVCGLFCASFVWAVSAPKVTAERLDALVDGGFENSHVEEGFPARTGVWSGDAVEISVPDAGHGGQHLRFISPQPDAANPNSRAISCDVFQLVDLRPLRAALSRDGDAVLELSASFLDARSLNTRPSVTCSCKIYVFKGDPTSMRSTWPLNIPEALSSGIANVTTLGGATPVWKTVTAKCLVNAEADFAIIQLAALPNLRPASLASIFADDIKLTLSTRPSLPVRIVHR
ncbi:MAG: hypothetical protein K9N47_25010 [Prosthecobacter sp.]|jgi:hypothetical protein|uniref:hypothetical protein n=1 Tax=Prosthecobacter sp. TaxID=1965333 RepID=UPI00263053E2|nr:hypothetical protein [Prosthecobacter sp.]MCF7789406.1 hypothetical protein [Prosthecobacter sp.]